MNHPIKTYRKAHRLTLEQFGKLVGSGVNKSIVSKWENGYRPSIENAMAIEAATTRQVRKETLRPDVWPQVKKKGIPNEGH